MNDGAGDAEDFIGVTCKCPCEGEVPHGGRLIDLVDSLRKQLAVQRPEEAITRPEDLQELKTLRTLVTRTEHFFATGVDDEGDFDTDALHAIQESYGEWRMGIYDPKDGDDD